jgi:hypothetical protein
MTTALVVTRNTSGCPEFAGSTWVRLQYVLGLERLGIRSYWIDRLGAVDPIKSPHSLDYLIDRFRGTAGEFGFDGRWCVVYDGGREHFGLGAEELHGVIGGADLLLNISGWLDGESPFMNVPRRAHIDVDPGFTQIWTSNGDLVLGGHTHFFTTGLNVGGPGFQPPLAGIEWQPTLPPVVLDAWPDCADDRCRRFSTVADWRGSQLASLDGDLYGSKRDEFVSVLPVARETGTAIEPAMTIGPGDWQDLGLLHDHGWKVRDPTVYAGDPRSYREFIQRSRAEFSVAKGGYVKSRSGWVSDRTACYLASGKPAIVQATGLEAHLPTGRGLLTFQTPAEAADAIRAVEADYRGHCEAARALAEERFDSDKVLTAMLTRTGL